MLTIKEHTEPDIPYKEEVELCGPLEDHIMIAPCHCLDCLKGRANGWQKTLRRKADVLVYGWYFEGHLPYNTDFSHLIYEIEKAYGKRGVEDASN